MKRLADIFHRSFHDSIAAKRRLLESGTQPLEKIAQVVIRCLRKGGKLLICGNGGSAADSQHIAAELVNRYRLDRAPLAAVALTTDTSILTSISNDYTYDEIFSKQVQALGRRGDVLWAISTSGRAKNVLMAVASAKRLGLEVVAFTGQSPNPLSRQSDWVFHAPSNETPRIQEVHITAAHAVCEAIEISLAKPGR